MSAITSANEVETTNELEESVLESNQTSSDNVKYSDDRTLSTALMSQTTAKSTLSSKKSTASSSFANPQLCQRVHDPRIASHVSTNITTEETIPKTKQTSCKTAKRRTNSTSATPLVEKTNIFSSKFRRIFQILFCCYCCRKPAEENTAIENSFSPENSQIHEVLNNEDSHDDSPVVLEIPDGDSENYIVSNELTDDNTSHMDLLETKNEENMDDTCLLSDDTNEFLTDRQSEHNVDEIVHEVLEQIKADIIDREVSIHDRLDESDDDINTQPIQEQSQPKASQQSLPDIYENPETEIISELEQPKASFYDTLPDIEDDAKAKLTQEYAEQKAYYDTFPDIDHKMESDVKKAEEFTQSILSQLPSGDAGDRGTACHVLNNLFKISDEHCLFFDSNQGINLHDAFQNVADIEPDDRPFVLKLSSSEGLGNIHHTPTKEDELKLVHALNTSIEQQQTHPVLDDIIERLARVHGVRKEDIVIQNVFTGTIGVVYTIPTSPGGIAETLKTSTEMYQNNFENFVSVKIHPLLHRPSFDISMFDARGNKTFPNTVTTFKVGPHGREELYTQPAGWTRFGLKVLRKYDNDHWLDPFRHPNNWYRAFHGTGRAKSDDFGKGNQSFDQQYAPADALASIYKTGFRKARVRAHGEGVYCSPDPKFPEKGYVGCVPVDTQKGKKNYKCMLQVAVHPDGVKTYSSNKIWVVADPKNIRPYGILIKEA